MRIATFFLVVFQISFLIGCGGKQQYLAKDCNRKVKYYEDSMAQLVDLDFEMRSTAEKGNYLITIKQITKIPEMEANECDVYKITKTDPDILVAPFAIAAAIVSLGQSVEGTGTKEVIFGDENKQRLRTIREKSHETGKFKTNKTNLPNLAFLIKSPSGKSLRYETDEYGSASVNISELQPAEQVLLYTEYKKIEKIKIMEVGNRQ